MPEDRTALSVMPFLDPQLVWDDTAPMPPLRVPPRRPAPLRQRRSGPLTVSVAGDGRMHDLPEWLARTHATSLLVVDRGDLVHEWYADGVGSRTRLLGASMTKSVLAHLVGRAVGARVLGLDDRVVDHVPELAGSGYQECRVADVLTMTSGVDWVEDYRDPDGPASTLLGCFLGSGGASRELLTRVGAGDGPGRRFAYCTADSQVLDWVRERATGQDFGTALDALWEDLGCEEEAIVGRDTTGAALAGGGLAATARDWSRVGRLAVAGTTGSGAPLLDPGWVASAGVPAYPFTAPGRLPSSITSHVGFARHWWPVSADGRRIVADGSRGQFLFVDRDTDVVVVKTSLWPYQDWLVDRSCRDLSHLGLAAVAAHVRNNRT